MVSVWNSPMASTPSDVPNTELMPLLSEVLQALVIEQDLLALGPAIRQSNTRAPGLAYRKHEAAAAAGSGATDHIHARCKLDQLLETRGRSRAAPAFACFGQRLPTAELVVSTCDRLAFNRDGLGLLPDRQREIHHHLCADC